MSDSDGGIRHFNAIRLRVVGSGQLRMRALSMDQVVVSTLLPLEMEETTNIMPTRLCNFKQQRASFRLETTEIYEYFKINRIIIFAKPLFSSYPG